MWLALLGGGVAFLFHSCLSGFKPKPLHTVGLWLEFQDDWLWDRRTLRPSLLVSRIAQEGTWSPGWGRGVLRASTLGQAHSVAGVKAEEVSAGSGHGAATGETGLLSTSSPGWPLSTSVQWARGSCMQGTEGWLCELQKTSFLLLGFI